MLRKNLHMGNFIVRLILFLTFSSFAFGANIKQQIFNDSLKLWDLYRDADNGLYCDTIRFDPMVPCGSSNNFYSSAGAGMGLVIKTIMAQYGFTNKSKAQLEVVETLKTVTYEWPKDSHTGFLIHFTNRKWKTKSEYSTIDSAILVLGGLFAGNYFGGEALRLAENIRDSIDWSKAIKASNKPRIYPVVDPETGEMSGNIRPYNEYFLVAYLANMTSNNSDSKAAKYFNTYMEINGGEPVGDGRYPVHKAYYEYDLLTDQPNKFMSSFIPQFCNYLSKGYQMNNFYTKTMFPVWLQADQLYWFKEIDENSTVWGVSVQGKLFGAGAGPGISGYSVERINGSQNLIVSAAIMAGFLPAGNSTERKQINKQLKWLYQQNVCSYPIEVNGETIKILWRCSIREPEWYCPSVDSIDYSTFTLGYATNFLPSNFFIKWAA